MNAMPKRIIERQDILPLDVYAARRNEERARRLAAKRDRRLSVGPYATLYFENYDTMWWQVHEMLWIERGGEEQIADELAAYNPLIPQGRELVATFMIEIDDPVRRARTLATLGGIEQTISLRIGDHVIQAETEDEEGRTKEDGKTSSIHFLRFVLSDAQAAAFRDGAQPVMVLIEHPQYGHAAIMPAAVRQTIAQDLD